MSRSTSHVSSRTPLILCALTVLTATPFVLSVFGCGGGMGQSSTSNGGDGVRGPITIENRSQFSICSATMVYDGGYASKEETLAPGGSLQLDVQGNTNRLYLTECGGERSLLGHPMNWYGTPQGATELLQGLSHDRIVLYDPGQAPADGGDHRAISLNPRPISDWVFFTPNADTSLSGTLHEALLDTARRESWSETLEFSLPLGEWNILRNRRTGIITGRNVQAAGFARWPDGHCTMQAFGYEQAYDGSDFSGPIRVGASTQLDIPCAVLGYAAGLSGSSASGATGSSSGRAQPSPSSGGSCSNTCNSANDGECDDGGPRSQYAVCALGTDCADCGAR